MKITGIIVSLLIIGCLGLSAAPQAEAFTLFGVRFFEKNQPTPTPTVAPTPTPEAVPTPGDLDEGEVLSDGDSLPSTGPEQNVGLILLGVTGAFVARKFWQVTHQL